MHMTEQTKQERAKIFMEKYGKDIEQANKTFFEQEECFVSGLYIDLACLKDLRMGLMLSLCKSQKDQQYLASNLVKYNNRPRRTFVKDAYPDFPYSEEELQKRYQTIGDKEFNLSPDTTVIFLLPALLNSYAQRKSMHDQPDAFRLTVNCFPLPVTPLLKQYFQLLERHLLHNLTIYPICQDPATLAPAFWHSNQVYFFDSLQHMLKPSTTMFEPFFKKHLFYNYHVYAPYEVEDEIYDVWLQEGMDFTNEKMFVTRFEPTQVYLQLCCKFSYLVYDIPLPHKS